MSLIKRFVSTVHTSLDRTLAGIENHEAVVDAALTDSREAVARARARLARLEKDGAEQRNRVAELTTQIELWNDRARSVATDDREKALTCIQRRRMCEQELHSAKAAMQEHEKIIKRVRDSITESTQRVQSLQSQRNQMRSREAAAHAGQIIHRLDGRVGADVEAAIERWEVSVGQAELLTEHYPTADSTDDFEQGFITDEENKLLESELNELLNNGENGDD
ncbi:MAG: PspA/IM30 family protein [Pseudomonadota bacterium]